jgi:hypothetical protein
MGVSKMSISQQVTLRPSQSYLFSYVWLAFELVGFNLMIHYFLPSNALFVLTLFMVCFARLYYWLDFSPESGFQTLFILGLIPLNWVVYRHGFSSHLLEVLLFYQLMFITLGSIRISRTNYFIAGSRLIIQLIRSKSFELDNARSFELRQHSRGKLLNFGCILVPIVESNNPKKRLLSTVLFHKRHDAIFSGFYRMDGIRNPKEVIQNLKNQTNL